uniref:Odorant receptor n=2 Tax=Octopus bimaculoides TaxID=37653 RepID=A0A0L8IHE2_OCTBM
MPKKQSVQLLQLFDHFQDLCSLLNSTNIFTQTQTLFNIVFSEICICSLIYGSIIRVTGAPEYEYIMIMSVVNGLHLVHIFQRGIQVDNLISKIRDRIYNINVPEYSIEMVSKINLVLSRINTGTIGISIGGIAVISPMLFVEILGIMLTYAIVVLQTQKE